MMSRLRARIIWFGLMLGVCLLPLFVFMIQDSLVMGKTVELNYQDEAYEIARNHPIIASLYSGYYSDYFYPLNVPEYNIKKELSQGQNKVKLDNMLSYFDEEINKLLQNQVIPYSLLELKEKEEFKVDFGYIKDFTEEFRNTLYLTQYYRLHTDNDVSTSYEYDQFSKKIQLLTITNKAINKLTNKELQTMCWNMISYLELDNIDDWHYSDYTYESKKAKLIVYCYISKHPSIDTLSIGISLRDTFSGMGDNLVILEEAF